MKGRSKKTTSLYQYLEPFLEKGNKAEIASARTQYVREYKARWRKEKRKREKEITCLWTKEELKILTTEAHRHQLSVTRLIKQSTLAYVDKRYVVPDILAVRKLLQVLAMQYNVIQEMIGEHQLNLQIGKILLEKIDEQERAIRVALYSPKTLEQLITETLTKNPQAKEDINTFIQSIANDP